MYKSGFKSLACGIAALASFSTAHAQENGEDQDDNHISVGVGVLLQKSPFNSAKTKAFPLPIISIKQGPFYFETAETGIRLGKNFGDVSPTIDLFVAARSPSGQDREKITADVGARISLTTELGTLSGEIRHDIINKFNGSEMSLRYSYPISMGKLTITPAVHASWLDRKTANYMFGVTSAQRAKMIAKERRVILPVAPINSDAHNLGGEIAMALQLTERLTLIGVIGGTYLDKAIHRSAAIDQKWEAQALLGISYRL